MRLLATTIAVAFMFSLGLTVALQWMQPQPAEASPPVTVTVRGFYQRHSAAYWHWQLTVANREIRRARSLLRYRWAPTVSYAMRLASVVSGVPYSDLSSVAWCESRHNPFARNGRYKGLFQLGWSPFGFSPYEPFANALSAALTVKSDGSWRQWECKP